VNLFEAVRNSEIVSIEGDNKTGKLTFTLYLISRSVSEKTLILSSIPKPILNKRIESIKKLEDEEINELIENKLEFLCLKENWEEIKAKYGFDFLIEDILYIVKDIQPKNIIFHRPDLMFNEDEFEFAKWLIDSLIELKENFHTRLFITTKENSIIENIIENYSDIDFEIKTQPERIVKVKSSLFPLKTLKYQFLYENGKLILKEFNKNITHKETKKHSMLLITQNDYLIKIHNYLFEKKFDITFAKEISQSIASILKEPEIVVFNPPEKTLNLQMCELASEKKLSSKIIYLINKDYVRTDDKMRAVYAGCYEIMPAKFNIEEYIFLIEKLIKDFFYTEKINQLPMQKEIKSFEHFCTVVDNFYNERIYFTVFVGECKNEDVLKHVRVHDIIFKTNNTFYICFVNANSHIFERGIKHKIQPQNYHLVEAIDWNEKGICL